MKQESDDPQLRQLFTEQRQTDARRAPAFEAVVARTNVQDTSWLRTAIVFAVVALMATVLLLERRSPEQLTASVLNWESPTAFLLETSLASPSDVTSSIAEIVPQLPQETTSTGKETP